MWWRRRRRRAVGRQNGFCICLSIKQIQTFDKMANGTHTHWRMTINNPDETDLALIQQGYPDHIRQLVWTPEVGENGTPHIQAFIKMKRDCRLSHMRKLFPRGNFGFLDSSEYRLNSQRYAQKQDETAAGPSIITNHEPFITIDGAVREVARRIAQEAPPMNMRGIVRKRVQDEMVMEDPTYARIFVGSSYVNIWTRYEHLLVEWAEKRPTHTHTHTDEEQSVIVDTYQQDGRSSVLRSEAESDDEEASSSGEGSDSQDASSTGSDGSSQSDSEESDCSTDGEQDDRVAGGEQRSAQQPNRGSGLRTYRATDFSWYGRSAAHR